MDDRPVGTVTPPPRTPPPPDAELDSSESTPRPRRGSRGSFYEYYLERKSVFSIESILHEVSSTLKHV